MAEEAGFGKEVVLIVDDDLLSRYALTCLVRQAGYEPVSTDCAEAAMEIADQRHFNMALVDLNLPGMNGVEFIRRLHTTSHDTVAILMTAAEEVDVYELLDSLPCALGDLAYLRKPLQLPRLMEILHSEPVETGSLRTSN